jgi:hypothetical protein
VRQVWASRKERSVFCSAKLIKVGWRVRSGMGGVRGLVERRGVEGDADADTERDGEGK